MKSLTPRKIAIARAAATTNKCVQSLAAIYGLTPRQVRRKIDTVKQWVGVECLNELGHWFHAHGIGFANEHERADYIEQQRELRG